MSDEVRDFYDRYAAEFHLIFENWDASIARQAAALESLLPPNCRVLDCACGIGTQSLGLAARGFQVTASDIAANAVERARAEASARNLQIDFYVADMLTLNTQVPPGGFDAVICMDNALPHLQSPEELAQAAVQIRAKLRPGGLFFASIRDYDLLIQQRPVVQGPAFHADAGRKRIVFQLWDWMDERRYTFHMYVTRETEDGWHTHHGASVYRALLRNELSDILRGAGFTDVRWIFPEESKYYQPIIMARA